MESKLLTLAVDKKPIPFPSALEHLSGGLPTAEKIVGTGITVLIIITVILALFYIGYSGIQWITSGGDKQKVQAARNRLTYAVIGLLVIFLTYFIVSFIGTVFGVSLFKVNTTTSQTTGNSTNQCPQGTKENAINCCKAFDAGSDPVGNATACREHGCAVKNEPAGSVPQFYCVPQ